MKALSIYAGINELAHTPGNKCVAVYWEPPTGLLYICECGDHDEKKVPDTATLMCSGGANKFFDMLKRLLTYDVFHRDDK